MSILKEIATCICSHNLFGKVIVVSYSIERQSFKQIKFGNKKGPCTYLILINLLRMNYFIGGGSRGLQWHMPPNSRSGGMPPILVQSLFFNVVDQVGPKNKL